MARGRAPCCDKSKVKRGPWSPAEDSKLISFIRQHGHTNWRALPKLAGTVSFSPIIRSFYHRTFGSCESLDIFEIIYTSHGPVRFSQRIFLKPGTTESYFSGS